MAQSDKPLDFTDANCSTLVVDTFDRPAGDIKYQQRLQYGEQYTQDNGSYQTTQVAVAWEDANDFIDFAVGYTEWDRADATRFHRVLPMASPYQATMHCDGCTMSDWTMHRGNVRQNSVTKWLEADAAFYDLIFRPRLYEMLTDVQVDGSDYPWAAHGCKELGRYVTRWPHPKSEELKLGSYTLEADNPATPGVWGNNIPEPGFVPNFTIDVLYTWHAVPFDAVPIDAIDECGGKTNNAAFDKKRNVADTAWVDRWAAETLVFRGTADRLVPYAGPNGEQLVDIQYRFEYRGQGFNKFPPPSGSGSWWPVRRRNITPTAYLYPTADFRKLFKPRTS